MNGNNAEQHRTILRHLNMQPYDRVKANRELQEIIESAEEELGVIEVDPTVVIDGDTTYDSTNVNVTQSNGFAILKIADGDIYDSLITYFAFDDNSSTTTAYDSSGLEHNGTYFGTAGYDATHSLYSGCMANLGYQTDYLLVNDSDDYNFGNNFTVSFWARPNRTDNYVDLNYSNVTKLITSSSGVNVSWKVYANDSLNQWNVSETFVYETTTLPVGDTCTYSSGNWNIDCSDNCNIASNVDLSNNNIIFTGAGYFDIHSIISNVNQLEISSNCVVSIYTDGEMGIQS